jgi:hypothetical protein
VSEVKWNAELLEYEEVFYNVLALYHTLKGDNRPQSIRRAEMKQGEVTAEPIDFLADVEIKARRLLSPKYYHFFLRVGSMGDYHIMPRELKQTLGLLFLRSDLNYDGAYRVLYFRAKNNQLNDRDEPQHFPEEATEVAQ